MTEEPHDWTDEDDEELDEELPQWEDGDLAPRLLTIPLPALRSALQAGPDRLETYLRGEVGPPPSDDQRETLELDSQMLAEHAMGASDANHAATRMLAQLSEEERDQIEAALLRMDPSETLMWEFRGLRPSGFAF